MNANAEKEQETELQVRLSFMLEAELDADIARVAKRNDRSVSAEIRQALREHVRRENGQKP